MRYTRSYLDNNCIAPTNYTQQLCQYLENLKYEDLPEEVVERAKLILVHTLGVSLAAKDTEVAKKADQLALMGNNGLGGSCTRWIEGGNLSAVNAALLSGVLADALDWEDCSYTGHPSAGIIPVAVIAAEEKHKSGKELITAIVGAYELYQRIANAVQPGPEKKKNGWGLTSWQVFGPLLAASKLYGLDARKIDQAIGMAIEHSTIPASYHGTTMSDFYHYEYGYRNRDAVVLAKAAEKGIHNQRDMLDDMRGGYLPGMTDEPKPEALTEALGERYYIMETLFKKWPANMWVQSALEAVAEIVTANDVKAEDVKEIIVDPAVKDRMCAPEEGYTSVVHAQFSIPFVVASYLFNPVPGADWYKEERLTDPEVIALAMKVKAGDSEMDCPRGSFDLFRAGDYPVKNVTLITNDGKEYKAQCSKHPGHPHNMFTKEEIAERFRMQAGNVLQGDRLEQALQTLLNVETVEDVAELGKFLSVEF